MQTSKQKRYLLRLVHPRISLFAVFILFAFSTIFSSVYTYTRLFTPTPALAATSSNLNYQARIYTSAGAVVPDGYYNVEFKLYNASSGGSSLWSESYYDSNGATAGNDNRVRVVNGYLSVNLASQTAFPGTINWDQDLWLTMNIGGSAQTATPTYDGEMNPRIKLTAVPYAFQAKQAEKLTHLQGANTGTLAFDTLTTNRNIVLPDADGTVCLQNSASCGFLTGSASSYIQNTTTLQSTPANFHFQAADSGVNGTIGGIIRGAAAGQTVDLLQLQGSDGSVLAAFRGDGKLQLGSTNTTSRLNIGVNTDTTSAGGITFGTDTNLYRSAANQLKTDDNFVAGASTSTTGLLVGDVGHGGVNFYGIAHVARANTSDFALVQDNLGSTVINAASTRDIRFSIANSLGGSMIYDAGGLNINSGGGKTSLELSSTGADTGITFGGDANLYRSNANELKTDDAFVIAGLLTGQAGSTISGAAINLNASSNFATNINTGTSTGAVNIGNSAAGVINLQSGGSNTINITAGGTSNTGTIVKTTTNSTAAFQIQNSASQNLFVADTTNQRVAVGPAAVPANGVLTVGTNTTAASGGLYFGTDTNLYRSAANTLKTDDLLVVAGDNTGTAQIGGIGLGAFNFTGISLNGTLDSSNYNFLSSPTANSQNLYINRPTGGAIHFVENNGSVPQLALASGGAATFRNGTNSSSAFQIQNAAGSSLITVDTTNRRISLDDGEAALANLFILDVSSAAPTGVNGGMYYDTALNKFRCYENGTWKDCVAAGAATNLQDAYNNSTSPATITTTSATKDIIFKSGTGFDSTSLFQIQNASSQNLFVADTVNQRVAVGPAAVPANGVLTVGTNTTAASGGIYFGSDVNLYRLSSTVLKSDSIFEATGLRAVNNVTSRNGLSSQIILGDVSGTPTILFGSAGDTNLYRGSVGNELKTDDALTAAGLITGNAGATLSGGSINLNNNSNFSTNINTGSSTGSVTIGNNTGNTPITIDSGTSTINIATGAQARAVNIATGSADQSLTLGSTNTSSATTIRAGGGSINLTASGISNTGTIVKTTSNSTAAFQIQNAAGTPDVLLRADTSNNRMYVGNATATVAGDNTLLVLDSATTALLPVGVNGGMIYDSTANKFKIYENGQYKTVCNMTDLACGAGATVTLQDVYNNSASPATITTTSATKDIIFKSGTGFNSTALFSIQNASSQNLLVADTVNQRVAIGPAAVPANGVLTVGTDTTAASGGIYFGTDTNLYRSNASELKTDDALVVAGTFTGQAGAAISGGIVNLNASSNFATNINTGTSTGTISVGNNTGNTAINLDSGTSAINIGTGAQARTTNIATGAAAQTLTLGSTNGASATTIQGGTGNINITASGTTNTGTIVKTTTNSTAAFQVQNAAGTPDVLFKADSTNNRVYVGNATATGAGDNTLFVVDSATTALLPVGVNGGIIYDSTLNKFKIYENGQYKVLCNTTDLGCGAAGASQDMQAAYDNSGTPATITTSSSTKGIIFKSGTGFNSTAIFQVQSAGSDVLFKADTTNNRVYVGNATASASGDSTLLVVDSSSTTNLPVGVNGGIIYDSTDNKFKIYENGTYKTLCNTTDLGCGAAGTSQSLQDAYNNSTTPAVITTTSATKDIIFRSGVGLNSTSVFQIQNASSQTLFVADTVNQRVAVGPAASPANGVLTVGTATSVASGGIYFGTDTNLYRSAAAVLRTDGSLQLGEGADRTFNVQAQSGNAAGNGLTIAAGDAGAGGSAFTGGALTLQGGNAAGTGNANGGNVLLTGGAGTGTGTKGLVIIDTPAFTTTTNTSCATNCSIAQSNIDSSGAVIVNATAPDIEITLPDPTNLTAGRIVYITAANASADFTMLVNGGGVGNQISMRQNTSATMIWNGVDWTAAGASSSTTLQAAYNNTLTSAGGAEILLNNSSSSNGLTIRNNPTNPILGSLFEVQSAIGNNLLSVNNNALEYVSNGGAETAGASSSTFPANTWSSYGGSTVSRNTTLSNVATGQASVQADTTGVSQGIKNDMTTALATNTTYQLSVTGKLSSGTFTTIDVYYTRDGGATMTPCVTAQAFVTTGWSKITCTFTTDGTTATDPEIVIRQSDTTSRTYYIDNLSVTLSTTVSTPPNVQIGGGIYGGTPTLLTLDRSSSPPVANGNDVYYGSMYYDTTSGRIQCYEADGWGACGSAPDNFVNLVPEYAGAVLNGSGVGTMSADFCANSGPLSVNSTLCASGQALNYYKWTSPQATQQTYSIYVTYQLPAAFKHFANDSTVSLTARTDNTANGAVTYQMYRSEGGSLTACGTETPVTTSTNTWQTVGINGNENTGCGFSSSSANNNVIFKINVKAKSSANVYVGTLSFTTIGQ